MSNKRRKLSGTLFSMNAESISNIFKANVVTTIARDYARTSLPLFDIQMNEQEINTPYSRDVFLHLDNLIRRRITRSISTGHHPSLECFQLFSAVVAFCQKQNTISRQSFIDASCC